MTPKDILTNPYFCPIPWTGMMYNFDGKVKNCIRSVENKPIGNIQDSPIEEILLGQENLSRQSGIVNQVPVPSCQTCYDLENQRSGFDIISDRIFYIRELKKTPTSTYTVGNFDLNTIDVRWSNLCNFACVYCSSRFSSKWANELNVVTTQPTTTQLQNFKDYIYQHAHKLRHVYLAGGEPLLMKENLELLSLLHPDVNLRINTNLSKTDTKIFEAICKFKNVHWTVSVESLEDQFEYIRYGGKWQDFLENLEVVKQQNHKITFNMLWFVLNYNSVFDCVDYLKSQGFHDNSFVVGALINPEFLNIRNLPNSVLYLLQNKLENRLKDAGYLLKESYINMLNYIQQPFSKKLDITFDKLYAMDQRRDLDSSKIFTELYKFKEEM